LQRQTNDKISECFTNYFLNRIPQELYLAN
jgi:hypothetical protein